MLEGCVACRCFTVIVAIIDLYILGYILMYKPLDLSDIFVEKNSGTLNYVSACVLLAERTSIPE